MSATTRCARCLNLSMSIWDSAAAHGLVDASRRDATAAQVFVDVFGKLRDDFYDRSLRDAVFQRYDGTISIEDAYAFSLIWADIARGVIQVQQFDIGTEPRRDCDRAFNHRALQNLTHFIDLRSGKRLRLRVE